MTITFGNNVFICSFKLTISTKHHNLDLNYAREIYYLTFLHTEKPKLYTLLPFWVQKGYVLSHVKA